MKQIKLRINFDIRVTLAILDSVHEKEKHCREKQKDEGDGRFGLLGLQYQRRPRNSKMVIIKQGGTFSLVLKKENLEVTNQLQRALISYGGRRFGCHVPIVTNYISYFFCEIIKTKFFFLPLNWWPEDFLSRLQCIYSTDLMWTT